MAFELQILGVGALLFSYGIYFLINKRYNGLQSYKKVPLIGLDGQEGKAQYTKSAISLVGEGYKKLRDSYFMLNSLDGYICIASPAHLKEVKNFRDDQVASDTNFKMIMMGKYTGVEKPKLAIKTIKVDLTQNLEKMIPTTVDEINYAFKKEFPPCKDWTSLNLLTPMLNTIALVNARSLVGPEVAHDEEWLQLWMNYLLGVSGGAQQLRLWHPWLRPIVQYTIPQVKKLKEYYAHGRKMLVPIIEARAEAAKKPGYVKPDDFMQWYTDKLAAEGMPIDRAHQAKVHMILGLASIRTISMTTTQALTDLATHPEYMEPLRQEIAEATEGGVFTKQSLLKLSKLDSFMKESQRMSPLNWVTTHREAIQPINFHDGTHLPNGAHMGIPAGDIGMDPANYPDPTTFHPWRFHDLTQQNPGAATRYQFVNVDETTLHWGYGRHACPGRFFASQTIKLMLSSMIQRFDIRLPDGIKERPPNRESQIQIQPSPTAMIQLKAVGAS